MESIITVATVLTMYLNAINDTNCQYFYNGDVEEGTVNKIEVYEKQGESMTTKMQYCYFYDEQGRLEHKDIQYWNAEKGAWENSTRLTYKYYKNGFNVENSRWDTAQQRYDIPSEVTLYREISNGVTSVRTYKMNETKTDMYLISKTLVMNPIGDVLYAIR